MQSNKDTSNQDQVKRTFIEEARRQQIIEATITVLASSGYGNASFARIAAEAGISPSLIPYHFKNKDELMAEVYLNGNKQRLEHIRQATAKATTATEKLRISLESDLMNMGARPERFKAMVEVIFSTRSNEGALTYMNEFENPLLQHLIEILELGQKTGEFGDFNVFEMANIIEGARDTFLAQLPTDPRFQLASYTKTFMSVVMKAVN